MSKEMPPIMEKMQEREIYSRFAVMMIKHFQKNLDHIYKKTRQGEIKIIKRSFVYQVFTDANRRVTKIRIENSQKGLYIDLGVGRGVVLDDIGYQKIGRSLLGRKVKRRRAGRWYYKTAFGQTLRLMVLVSELRSEEYTVMVKSALEFIDPVKLKV